MKLLGRLGGLAKPMTKLRANVDDELREQARSTLSRALAGEDVPKPALDAARSLFAYRPSAPPAEAAAVDGHGRKIVVLKDLLGLCVELGIVTAEGGQVVVDGKPVARTREVAPTREKSPAASQLGALDRPQSPDSEQPAQPHPEPAAEHQNGFGAPDEDAPDFDLSESGKARRKFGEPTRQSWRWT